MRKAVLLINTNLLISRSHYFCAADMGKLMLVAMHIAGNGPLNIGDIRKVAMLRGRAQWLDTCSEKTFFVRSDGFLDLKPEIFSVTYRGSDRKRVNLSAAVRETIHERDSYRCTYCGTGDGPFEIDHIHPIARGGTDDLDNLCLACAPCNRAKSDKLIEEWVR